MTDAPKTISGAGVLASIEWIRTTYGESAWQDVLDALSEADVAELAALTTADRVPVQAEDRRWRAFAERCHGTDRVGAEDAFCRMGRHIAHNNLTGVYQLAGAVLEPRALTGMVPKLFSLYCDGAEAEVVEVSDDGRDGRFIVRGMGELNYLAPVVRGWIEYAVQQAGVQDVRVTERAWDEGTTASDELLFRVVW
jgi:hypothetical protein